ncbi:MAG: hypothetical protein IPM22_09665 [Betaproteobacteria bacterium]|nr:hypothetical protein [Betaproteobacteria bacterium]
MQHHDVFIVHVWTDELASCAFRASAQRAGTDESAWFTNSGALVRYLATCGCAAMEDTDGARAGDATQPRPPG